MIKKLRLIEFIVLIIWTLVMIGLSIVSVVKAHDFPLGIATAYGSCMGAFAIRQWSSNGNLFVKGEDDADQNTADSTK